MNPDQYLTIAPEKAAVIMAETGDVLTYRELVLRSRRLAHALRSGGVVAGDHLVALVDTPFRVFEIAWAAHRLGLYYTFLSWHWGAETLEQIVRDLSPRVFIATAPMIAAHRLPSELADRAVRRLVVDTPVDGYASYEGVLLGAADGPVPDEVEGQWLFYSSGSSGRPKGVKLVRPPCAFGTRPHFNAYGLDGNTVYLSPSALFFGGGLRPAMLTLGEGGIVVLPERFVSAGASGKTESPQDGGAGMIALLEHIAKYRVTAASLRPEHLVTMA
ncbi:MAG: AMP-binding protein, partial [Polyangiaceae bacterium]